MIAAMYKLVAAIYSVAKHRRPFVARISPHYDVTSNPLFSPQAI
jgi:hypothetical protein